MTIDLLVARAELYAFAWANEAYVRYVQREGIDVARMAAFAGASALTKIVDCGGGRFDWPGCTRDEAEQCFDAFLIEVLEEDGEMVLDIIAWPLSDPGNVFSMFGQAVVAGAWEAFNPASYYMGKALVMHRTPLDWLKAGCRGATIVNSRLAARALIDMPGPIAARDRAHAAELANIIRSAFGPSKIVVATDGQKDERAA